MDSLARKVTGDLDEEDFLRVSWLSGAAILPLQSLLRNLCVTLILFPSQELPSEDEDNDDDADDEDDDDDDDADDEDDEDDADDEDEDDDDDADDEDDDDDADEEDDWFLVAVKIILRRFLKWAGL